MISLELHISGRELGAALARDPEELSHALIELIEYGSDNLGDELWSYLPDNEEAAVIDFLRLLADQIEAAGHD